MEVKANQRLHDVTYIHILSRHFGKFMHQKLCLIVIMTKVLFCQQKYHSIHMFMHYDNFVISLHFTLVTLTALMHH